MRKHLSSVSTHHIYVVLGVAFMVVMVLAGALRSMIGEDSSVATDMKIIVIISFLLAFGCLCGANYLIIKGWKQKARVAECFDGHTIVLSAKDYPDLWQIALEHKLESLPLSPTVCPVCQKQREDLQHI